MQPTSAASFTNPPNTNSPSVLPCEESRIEGDECSNSDQKTGSSIAFRRHEATAHPLPVPDAPASATTVHTAPQMAARSATGTQAAQAINTEPQMIADGVFIGEGRAKSGEKFFLKMEKITPRNKAHWHKYLQATLYLCGGGRSLLKDLIRTTEKATAADGTRYYRNEHYDEVAPLVGQSKEEFHAFINLLGKRGFSSAPEDKSKRAALMDIDAGAGSFSLGTSDEFYVICAMKKADFQMPVANNHENLSEPLNLKEYLSLYGDLLMCVSANFSWKDGFHSRGIFRNPCNTIANTHKGIAMILHGFTGTVAKKYFPDKQALFVKPITSMQYLISSSLQPDDYSVQDYSHEEALAASKEAFLDGDNFEMPMNRIKVSALDRLYRNHAAT